MLSDCGCEVDSVVDAVDAVAVPSPLVDGWEFDCATRAGEVAILDLALGGCEVDCSEDAVEMAVPPLLVGDCRSDCAT